MRTDGARLYMYELPYVLYCCQCCRWIISLMTYLFTVPAATHRDAFLWASAECSTQGLLLYTNNTRDFVMVNITSWRV